LARPTTATCRGPSPIFSCAQCPNSLDTASKPHASSEGSLFLHFPFAGSCVTGGGRKDEAARKSNVGCSERKCVAHVVVGSRGHVSTVDLPSAMTTSTPGAGVWGSRTDLVKHKQQPLALLRRNACLQGMTTVCKRISCIEDFNHDVCFVEYDSEMW
jgi:hypothetical protein